MNALPPPRELHPHHPILLPALGVGAEHLQRHGVGAGVRSTSRTLVGPFVIGQVCVEVHVMIATSAASERLSTVFTRVKRLKC